MNAIFLEGQKMEPYFDVRDRNSQQKFLPTHHKMKQIAVIPFLTTMKPTARKQPQPSKKYYKIPNSFDKTVVSLIIKYIVMELET
jgi:hypothetical protein